MIIFIKIILIEDDYLQFGFVSICIGTVEKPQCVICQIVLSADSMRPNKLKAHFENVHPTYQGKNIIFFHGMHYVLSMPHFKAGYSYVEACDKLGAFSDKLKLWKKRVQRGKLEHFHNLKNFIDAESINVLFNLLLSNILTSC